MIICGPIISTSNMDAHIVLHGPAGFGLTFGRHHSVASEHSKSLLGETIDRLDHCWMAKENTAFGVRIWSYGFAVNDQPCNPIRDPGRGTDRDAPKVIDFYAPDFHKALDHLADAGWQIKDNIADYDLPEGPMQEAHLWGPDNVVTAVISGPPSFFSRFATVCDQTFSEPQSISTPVTDMAAAIAFYDAVFGLKPVYQYEIENASFDALVGASESIKLRATNIGVDAKEPYFGLIDYGWIDPESVSLRGAVRPPARGLVGVELLVNDLAEIKKAAASHEGAKLLGAAHAMPYAPYGIVNSILVEGPHGMLHHVMERTSSGVNS